MGNGVPSFKVRLKDSSYILKVGVSAQVSMFDVVTGFSHGVKQELAQASLVVPESWMPGARPS